MYTRDSVLSKVKLLAHEIPADWLVNWGGCGVFAALAGRHLASKGLPVRHLAAAYHLDNKPNVHRCRQQLLAGGVSPHRLENWGPTAVGRWQHILVEVPFDTGSVVFDADGPLLRKGDKAGRWRIMSGWWEQEEVEAFARDGKWNSVFNRRHMPALAALIKEHL